MQTLRKLPIALPKRKKNICVIMAMIYPIETKKRGRGAPFFGNY
jgi:hypothetical protein